MGLFTHLAKALVSLTQDFADNRATNKVHELLTELEENLRQSRVDLDTDNNSQIEAFNGM